MKVVGLKSSYNFTSGGRPYSSAVPVLLSARPVARSRNPCPSYTGRVTLVSHLHDAQHVRARPPSLPPRVQDGHARHCRPRAHTPPAAVHRLQCKGGQRGANDGQRGSNEGLRGSNERATESKRGQTRGHVRANEVK
eukprot:716985-Pyramimonas_sp.AAC.2